jgi:two-component sensor histidine kinase
MLLARYHRSPILSGLYPERETRWKPTSERRYSGPETEIALRGFSFIERPAETMKALRVLGEIEAEKAAAKLHFDDPHCVDIAPYLVLAEIWPEMARVFSGGRMQPPVQKVIEAVGLRKPLGMRLGTPYDPSNIWAFPLRRRRPARSSRALDRELAPQAKEKVSDDFCDAVDEWLAQADNELCLTVEGKSTFCNIIGELLDNAERHSDPLTNDGSWSVAAFMARRTEDGVDVLRCYMAFLSVGVSIAESLSTAAPNIRNDVETYCARHKRAGQSEETLATLVALQDGVTRDVAAESANRGGIGLQDVMAFIRHLGSTDIADRAPRMTIVSGRSCIQLRQPYLVGSRRGDGSPRMLWCNAENSPEVSPDPQFVFDLEDRFAGTVVGLSFVLDADYLRTLADATDRSERIDG